MCQMLLLEVAHVLVGQKVLAFSERTFGQPNIYISYRPQERIKTFIC